MSGVAWAVEWRTALARPRLMVLDVAIPLLMVVPVALAEAPEAHAAAVYTILFTLFGTFGSAIPLVRDGERGLLTRLWLAGITPATLVLERTLAGAVLDTLQLLPSLLLVLLVEGAPPSTVLASLAALPLVLLVAGHLGAWVAALAGSLAEAALFAAVVSLLLLHGAGVFRTPAPGSWAASLETGIPFSALHHTMLGAASGTPVALGGNLLPLLAGAVAASGASALLSRPTLRRLTRRP